MSARLPAEMMATYSSPDVTVVAASADDRVQVVAFHAEPVRGWGFDVWVSGQRIHSGVNTEHHALWLAGNFSAELRPAA